MKNIINLDELYSDYNQKMDDLFNQVEVLRQEGTTKISKLSDLNNAIKKNKTLTKAEKQDRISKNNIEIETAKKIELSNKSSILELINEAQTISNNECSKLYKEVDEYCKAEILKIKQTLANNLLVENNEYKEKQDRINNSFNSKNADTNSKIIYKNEITSLKKSHKNIMIDLKSHANEEIQKIKDIKHEAYLTPLSRLSDIRNGKNTLVENISMSIENYVYQFNLSDFLIKNGLYIIMILFMIACIIDSPSLIKINATMSIITQFSTKVFFALGVASLILFGGTDLSVGRMVTLGSIVTCMFLNPSSTTKFFGVSLSGLYGTIGFIPTAIIALVTSVILCVIFSLLAGFFTAKFKIHPFITTLGTSLIIWGTVGYGTDNVKTGTVTEEASNLVSSIFKMPGFSGIPLTLFYAIIAIIITWFVWNKTTFGKNMYAVGGNSEAASVSGINVFKVTMGIFGMAAVLYGVGAFFQGLTTGSSSSVLGQGWELEAIAACVVGGISFSGGIGKVSGAVIGCLLFEILKYYLREITGGSADITNIFIGIIIIVAVTFDSMKYLKKK